MASTGNIVPTVGSSVDRAGNTAWTTPGNVTADDANNASAAVPTDYLVTSGYSLGVPALATILGVTVRVEASETGTGNSNYTSQLQSDTTPTLIGSPKSPVTVNGTTPVISSNGGTSDLWSATLTPEVVNAAGFGASIWSTDTTNTLSIDFVTIAVEYSTIPLTREMDAPRSAATSRVAINDGFIGPNLLLSTLAPVDVEEPLLRGPVFVDRPRERTPEFLEPQANLLLSSLAAGPIQQSVDGSVAIAGALIMLTATSKTAAVASAGALVMQTGKLLTAAAAIAGTLTKETRTSLAASVAISGTLETLRVFLRAITGSVAIAGTLAMSTSKLLAGTATSAGTLLRHVGFSLAGAMSSAGTLLKETRTSLAGSVASSSTLTAIRVFLRSVTGSVAIAGTLERLPLKALEGAVAIAGSIERAIAKSLEGAVTIQGVVSKLITATLSGAVAIAGALIGSIPSSVFTVVYRVRSRLTTFRTSMKNRTHTVRPKS
jgi:hypothetical protein